MDRIINKYFYCEHDPLSNNFGRWYTKAPYMGRHPQWILDDINLDLFKNGIHKRVTLYNIENVLRGVWLNWLYAQKCPMHYMLAAHR